jgi:hypothetical protein
MRRRDEIINHFTSRRRILKRAPRFERKIQYFHKCLNLIQSCSTLRLAKAENCGLTESECNRLRTAADDVGTVSGIARQQIGRHNEGRDVVIHGRQELYKHRNPKLVDHIHRIYRNNM